MKSLLLLVPAMLAAGCTVTVDSQGQSVHEEKRFMISGTPFVTATTFDGSIQVQSWDNPDVLVEIEKRGPTKTALDDIQVYAAQDGNSIIVEAKRPTGHTVHAFGLNVSSTARLTVWVPKRADIHARSGDGSVSIEHVNGKLEVHTGDGSVRANDVTGNLKFSSGDGSITIENAQGQLDVDTGDGSVNVAGKFGIVRLHSGDGSMVYRAEPGTKMEDDWEVTTGDGGVTLYLPPDFAAELDAHTGDGSVRSDLYGDDRAAVNNGSLRTRIGAGGKLLRIRTTDGSVRLKRIGD